MAAGSANSLQRRNGTAGSDFLLDRVIIAFKAHAVLTAAGADVYNQPLRKRIHNGSTNTVQATRIAVILMIELAAGMQPGEDHFNTGNAQFRMNVYRHTAPIIFDRSAAILMKLHTNAPGKAVCHLVDRIIHDLPEQVMQAACTGRTDVHTRTHPDSIKSFEHLKHACRIRFCHE